MEKGRRDKSGSGGDRPSVEISVRRLVEFILRSGDIDNRRHANITDAMLEGARIHRRIQGRQGGDYVSEVPLSININCDFYDITVSGRADGIITGTDKITVDEIKGMYADVDRLEQPVPVHLAQAMCYAYIHAKKEGLEHISVRMTYCSLGKDNIRFFEYDFSFDDLSKWFNDLIEEYKRWAEFGIEWAALRDDSIHAADFPYEYRAGQKELAGNVYRTIVHGRKLFLEAPTGVGKTLAVLFPSIKAIGEKKAGRVFYLTAKNAGATVANETFSLFRQRGLRFKTVNLMAKEKLCISDCFECNPEKCSCAKGHYDRINEALFTLLQDGDDYSIDHIRERAQEFNVCPFEMALDLSLFCDGVICDYNYAFDPKARLKRFFGQGLKGDHIFLVDEAHNLVDRGREMFSASLSRRSAAIVKKRLRGLSRTLSRHLNELDRTLKKREEETEGEYRLFSDVADVALSAGRFAGTYEDVTKDHPIDDEEVLQFYFDVRAFLDIYEVLNGKYRIYGKNEKGDGFTLRLYNTDPSDNLAQCLDNAVSTVFFSATLLPVRYYMDLLAGREDDYAVYARSVFDPSRLGVFISTDVSSKYNRRSQNEYEKITCEIRDIISARKGNYMLFFPSYDFMEKVFTLFERDRGDDVRCLVQDRGMTEDERVLFLEEFDKYGNSQSSVDDKITAESNKNASDIEKSGDRTDKITLVGFCVLGGVFSEGIDLTRESLIGAVIVGTGLPMVCTEREILRDYFEASGMNGFDYAYRFPGMNKVLQAAGRVIRTEKDTGIAVLMDERFGTGQYRMLFPKEWVDIGRVSNGNAAQIADFWQKQQDRAEDK
ncbi:MAG: ATP-dependent DNA helicase [Lachnospiraceae bacterium]|nr:ATP-dependent DNA helicase [Lachnospiraceae bacterium]